MAHARKGRIVATKTVVINRSAKTGEFVKPGYVKTHPATTTTEHRRVTTPPPKTKK